MSNRFANYSVNDFDTFDCLKLSKGFYLTLLYVLRAYIVFIMSVTNMRDKVAIIQWLYPQPDLFYLSLISGAIGLYLLLIISLRRPEAADWVKKSWRNYRIILVFALLFDLGISAAGLFLWQLMSVKLLVMHLTIAVIIVYFSYTSDRVALNLEEFPEKLPEE